MQKNQGGAKIIFDEKLPKFDHFLFFSKFSKNHVEFYIFEFLTLHLKFRKNTNSSFSLKKIKILLVLIL